MSAEDREGYISLHEAAEQYRVGYSTIWSWISADRLPTYKFHRDRRTYVKCEELEALLHDPQRTGRPGGWRKES